MYFFVFPGQGSQQPGMGRFLFDTFPLVQEIFHEASEVLNLDLKELCFNGSDADLALTENTQPALLLVSTATQRVLREVFGVKCNLAAGHSIGEYAALVSAGVLEFADAMRAVRLRGQAMQSAVPVGQGGMVALLGLEAEQAEALCHYVSRESKLGSISPANFNCPGQIVLSGALPALNWLRENFKPENLWPNNPPKRLKMIALNVSAPFHCPMMDSAMATMREFLEQISFKNAQFPIIQNLTAKAETQAETLRENLIQQVSNPVLWMQSMQTAQGLGARQVIECGAGKILQGLLKKIAPEYFQVMTTASLDDMRLIESNLKENP